MFSAVFLWPGAVHAQNEEVRRKMEESVARQKAAIQKQLGTGGGDFFSTPWTSAPLPAPAPIAPEPPCPPISEAALEPMVAAAAAVQRLPAELIRAVIRQESAFRPCAVSAKGALGLMQLMPETAGELGVDDPFDAAQNVEGGAQYLRQLMDRFHDDLTLALAAYNAGPTRVSANPPAVPLIPETQNYVEQILKRLVKAPEKPTAARMQNQR